MVFDTAIDNHSVLPLTLEKALDEWSLDDQLLDSHGKGLQTRRPEKSFCLPAAPPSTRKSSFELFDYTSHDKVRRGSHSSHESIQSMVEDHSGISDSDADPYAEHDPYEESMARLWDTYETLLVQNEASEAIMFHIPKYSDDLQTPLPPSSSEVTLPVKASRTQTRVKSRPSRGVQTGQRTFIPIPTRTQSWIKTTQRRRGEPHEGQYTQIPDPTPLIQAPRLHRSHAQRSARPALDTLKSLPPPPHKRVGSSLPSSPSKRSRSQPPNRPPPHRQHPTYSVFPHHSRPATNPCNSSHGYSFHNTPPLPFQFPVETSVFEYDTDDENRTDSVTHLSSSLAKLHIRSFSLGSKFGLAGKKDGNKYGVEGSGRRRSATEIVMGVLGLGKK
jgi:hypothetical protein